VNIQRIILAFILTASLAGACSSAKNIRVKGLVRLVGNEPFTRLVVTAGARRHYFIPGKYRKQYFRYVNHFVEIEGSFTKRVLHTADRKHTIIEFILVDIRSLRVIKKAF